MGRRGALLLAIAGLASALSCYDFDAALEHCQASGRCLQRGDSGVPMTDGAVDAGGDAGSDAGPTVGSYNFMFVTSVAVIPSSLGGLAAADTLCQRLAVDAGLPGTYVAWLSTSTTAASSRLGNARGWIRPDGQPFADSVAALTRNQVFHAPTLDEHGRSVTAYVATGTDATGALTPGENCGDWSSDAGNWMAGSSVFGSGAWTNFFTRPCTIAGPVYCFGIDYQKAIGVTPPIGKRVFVSGLQLVSDSGVAFGDAVCANEATDAGLSGTFRALLATTTAPAASRFADGGSWSRLDGIVVGNMLVGSMLLAPPNVAVTGAYITFPPDTALTWTGATQPTLPAPSTGLWNCMDWSGPVAGAFGYQGLANAVDGRLYFENQGTACNGGSGRFYCLEE